METTSQPEQCQFFTAWKFNIYDGTMNCHLGIVQHGWNREFNYVVEKLEE